jgi:hypothetical protein
MGICRAVLRERTGERGLLLFEGVLLFFAVELDEHLPRRDAVAKVSQDGAHRAVGFGRDRDVIDGGERADNIDRSGGLRLAHRLDRDGLRGGALGARLSGVPLRTTARRHGEAEQADGRGANQAPGALAGA